MSKKTQISSNSSLRLFFFDIREVREMHSLGRAASMSTELGIEVFEYEFFWAHDVNSEVFEPFKVV